MPYDNYDACRHMLMLLLTGRISTKGLDSLLPPEPPMTKSCDEACPVADVMRNVVQALTLLQYANGEPTAIAPLSPEHACGEQSDHGSNNQSHAKGDDHGIGQ